MPFLGIALVWALAFTWLAAGVGVEKNNTSLNAQDPAARAVYDQFKATFGNDEELLVAVADPQLLEPVGLRRLRQLTTQIAGLDGVRNVMSLTTAMQVIHGDAGSEIVPLLAGDPDDPATGTALRDALDRNPDLVGWLVSADRRVAAIVVDIEERSDDDYRAALIVALRDIARRESKGGVSLHLTGIAVQKYDVSAYIERDQAILMPAAVLILATLLAVFFQRLLGVLLPLLVTWVSVVTTLGLYRLAGFELNAITALLPPVIMVLSIAVSVHLVQAWLRATDLADNQERIAHVVRELFFPCFYCSLTTALGFASLAVAEIPAVQQFGLFAALGVSASFVFGMALVPVGLSFLPPPTVPLAAAQHRLLDRALAAAADLATRHPAAILLVAAILTATAGLAIPGIRNNTDLVRFLRKDAPLYRDTMFIDAHLTGTHAIEWVVERVDGTPLTRLADVNRMAEFERAAREHQQVATTTSIVAVLRQLHRGEIGGPRLALPESERDLGYLFDLLEAAPDRTLIGKLIAADFRRARISVRLHALGTADAAPLVDEMQRAADGIFGGGYRVTPTGAFHAVVRDSNHLVEDQVTSFATGLLAVFLAIGLLFRSWKPTLVALIPNVIPIVWTAGIMGACGIDLSTGTAMIASAVLGLVVDDTIHYLAYYRRSYQGDATAAVRATTTGVGSALVLNNLVLVLGFWVGCFGSFKPTIYFALLSGITMITAMLCDLSVTPACLVLLDRISRGGSWRRRAASAGLCVTILSLASPVLAADDVLLRHIVVPSPQQPVGEVRLLRRGETDVVETLLVTKVLRRVVGEIRKKELANWPPGHPHHEVALRYADALAAAQAQIWERVPKFDRGADPRQRLSIEFVVGERVSYVDLAEFEAESDHVPRTVTTRRPIVHLDLPRAYVQRNMRLIVADSFELSSDALRESLRATRWLRQSDEPEG